MAMKHFSGALTGKLTGALTLLVLSTSALAQTAAQQPTLKEYEDRQVVIDVPPGNRNAVMPDPGDGTIAFLLRMGSDLQAATQKKYAKTLSTLTKDNGAVLRMINKIAPLYDLKPIHILGAIVGEHTFNVNIIDDAQKYLMIMHSKWTKEINGDQHPVYELTQQPEMRVCDARQSSYEKWSCVGSIWQSEFRGRKKNGKQWPEGSLLMAFFDPRGVGKTYGLGQMSPLRVLMTTDIVHARGGLPVLSEAKASDLYEAVLDVETTIHYIAANMVTAIHYYNKVAGFDISNNPGVTATLYNMGNEKNRAHTLYKENLALLKKGQPLRYPSENHYGWWINDKRAELEALLAKYPAK